MHRHKIEQSNLMTLSDHEEESDKSTKKVISTVFTNVFMILLVSFAWVLQTQFAKTVVTYDRKNFDAPYFIMWMNTDFMMLCYPFYLIVMCICGKNMGDEIRQTQMVYGKNGITLQSVLKRTLPFLVIWIGANYAYVKALLEVSSSVATSISSCNAAMVWLLAIFILGDRFVPLKLISVFLAIAGVVLISLDKQIEAQFLGVLFAILSATCSALYKVFFKRIIKNATLGQVSLFMSCLGLLNFTLNAIPMLVMALSGSELVQLSYAPVVPLIVSGFLTLLFNFVLNFGVALLNPLVISVGMLFGVPLNAVVDIVFRDIPLSLFFISGSALIVISVVFIIFPYDAICSKTVKSGDVEPSSEHDPNKTSHC